MWDIHCQIDPPYKLRKLTAIRKRIGPFEYRRWRYRMATAQAELRVRKLFKENARLKEELTRMENGSASC